MSIKKYIGDKHFYKAVIALSLPIMIQSGITNFVGLLDNIMVGTLGTEDMSGVSIVNQFLFVFNLMIFGAISAAGIFTAQYSGFRDNEGIRYTFRFKILINLVAGSLGVLLFAIFGEALISSFLHEGSTAGDLSLTLERGKTYLAIMLIGLVPYAISQVYASTMRETGHTVPPMVASIVAVATNFALNAVLIFGLYGAPALGVAGAAIATVISRFVELLVLVLWGHLHPDAYPYLAGAYRSLRVPKALFLQIIRKGLPLMFNELFWSLAITMRSQCYSLRGLDVVAAQNINSTIVNLFNVVYLSLGSSIAIVVGNQLGAGEIEPAKDSARKMMAFSITCASLMGLLMILLAKPFGLLYNTEESVRSLAAFMIVVSAITMPFSAYAHAAYFTLRTGGKVMITLLFDCVYMWAVVMPISILLSYGTALNITYLFIICQGVEAAKCILGFIVLKKGNWAKQLVSDENLKA